MVLTHCVNLGKGRGLKTGLNYIYTEYPECIGVVTVDGDGQHSAEDTLRVAEAMERNPGSLIMGCRNFEKENVPARSRFGNVTTSRVLKLLCGIALSDTQTGLRGIPRSVIPGYVTVSGERFEYELNMILDSKENDIPIVEVEIETIYLEDNASSHFNPLLDSIRIYSLFVKFLVVSLSSSVIDLLLFSIFCFMCKKLVPEFGYYIVASTVAARILSAIYNYSLNKNKVFKNRDGVSKSAVRYVILAVVNMAASAALVYLFFDMLHFNETLIKVVVDTVIFFLGFQIQREWVFKK